MRRLKQQALRPASLFFSHPDVRLPAQRPQLDPNVAELGGLREHRDLGQDRDVERSGPLRMVDQERLIGRHLAEGEEGAVAEPLLFDGTRVGCQCACCCSASLLCCAWPVWSPAAARARLTPAPWAAPRRTPVVSRCRTSRAATARTRCPPSKGAGLIATLADADDDPGFDSSRDATGCEVEDQDPSAGEMAAEGDEVMITVSCAQVDWENQEGTAWESFGEAYNAGFDAGCEALFNESSDGSMYEDDTQYTATDCENQNPGDASEASDVPGDVPDDPEAASTELGELDGCTSMFDNGTVVSLNYGERSWTDADCPIGAVAASRDSGGSGAGGSGESKRGPKQGGSSPKGVGETCIGEQSDGTPITMQVEIGEVSCSGAEALWNEYLRRAPGEGVGSGGAVKLEGWSCIAASAAQAPRAGSCEAGDDSGSFTVSTGE